MMFFLLFFLDLFRLAGVALVVPYINYKWPSLPKDLTRDDYRRGLSKWTVFVASYAPSLLHWWLTQKLFPSSTVLDRNPTFFSRKDLEVLKNTPGYQLLSQVRYFHIIRQTKNTSRSHLDHEMYVFSTNAEQDKEPDHV